jgi:hypothetical protein
MAEEKEKITRVVNCKRERCDVYIGRPSKWGNPFFITKFYPREEAIKDYEIDVRRRPELLADLHELKGKTLGCHCAPLPCHGDVLIKLIEEMGI